MSLNEIDKNYWKENIVKPFEHELDEDEDENYSTIQEEEE